MQEIHHSAGDRRARPNHHQILKCPRCESLNTKFCYYNNYNLSQPRHFCKSCRRYWTKGGLLRNITVGSGSRKPKRSNNKSTAAPPPEPPSSSSESCSTATESTSNAASNSYNFRESTISAATESFNSRTTSTNEALEAFGSGNNSDYYYYNDTAILDASSYWFGTTGDELHVAASHGGSNEQQKAMGTVDFSSLQNGEFGSLNWRDQDLVDLLPNGVDDQVYWTHTHWSHQDNHALFQFP